VSSGNVTSGDDLLSLIRSEIDRRGPLPFDRFMEIALYHPELGYYCRPGDPFGVAGDYFTNSQLQPVFGRLISREIARWQRELGVGPEFTAVELGPGRGETAAEVRRCLPGVRYLEVERRAGSLPERFTGVLFSNEFFDALPVRVARFEGGRWVERCVGWGSEGLEWADGGSAAPEMARYLERFVPRPAPSQVAEVNLEALGWLERIARSLERGGLITIDYGYTSAEIAAGHRFPQGSLMSYLRHTASENVFSHPGEQDITAHVNFTALVERGSEWGLAAEPLQTQAQFLLSIGQGDEFRSALEAASETQSQRHRALLKTLLFGMGETFQVLVQRK
jgi:SAM-dependent MidA family methyltransferase